MLQLSPTSPTPERHRSPGRGGGGARRLRGWVAGLLSACTMLAAAAEPAPLLLVQPMDRTPVANVMAQHFARWMPQYLGEKAVLHRPSNHQGLDAIAWAAQSAPPDRTVMMMSQLWLSRLDGLPASTPGARDWVPLQVVLQGTWCLMAPAARHLPDFPALQAWLRTLGRPVRLSVPHNFGFTQLWIQAMARKTGLPWQAVTLETARESIQALLTDRVDLALERCGDTARYLSTLSAQGRNAHQALQVLARGSTSTSLVAPLFSQWQLPPLPLGWVAWFVPASMPPARQEAIGRALNAIALREDTQALIAQEFQQPVRMSVADSQQFVRRSQEQGVSLRNWLERAADPGQGLP